MYIFLLLILQLKTKHKTCMYILPSPPFCSYSMFRQPPIWTVRNIYREMSLYYHTTKHPEMTVHCYTAFWEMLGALGYGTVLDTCSMHIVRRVTQPPTEDFQCFNKPSFKPSKLGSCFSPKSSADTGSSPRLVRLSKMLLLLTWLPFCLRSRNTSASRSLI